MKYYLTVIILTLTFAIPAFGQQIKLTKPDIDLCMADLGADVNFDACRRYIAALRRTEELEADVEDLEEKFTNVLSYLEAIEEAPQAAPAPASVQQEVYRAPAVATPNAYAAPDTGSAVDYSVGSYAFPAYRPPQPAMEEALIFLQEPATVAGMSWQTCVESHQCIEVHNQTDFPISIDIGGQRLVMDMSYGQPVASVYNSPTGPKFLIPGHNWGFIFLGHPTEYLRPHVVSYAPNRGTFIPFRACDMGRKRVSYGRLRIRDSFPWDPI